MDDEKFAQAWNWRCDTLHEVNVSYRYHRRRQRFFDLLDKGTKALTVLAGASLLADPIKAHLPWMALVISGLGLLALVYGYGDRKQTHKELADSYMGIAADIERTGRTTLEQSHVSAWRAEYMRLNSREPPTLYTLATICQNEQHVADGHPDQARKVSFVKAALSNWFSFG